MKVYNGNNITVVENGTAVIKGRGHGTDENSGAVTCQDEAHKLAEMLVHELDGNVYDFPSTEKVIRYHHDAINEFFPESNETQKGHMKQQQQNTQSTKVKDNDDMSEDLEIKRPIEHKQDVYVKVYDATKRLM
ncbi:hypothetical protein ACHAW6_002206 [Cyclotella cf. meneghiniana]